MFLTKSNWVELEWPTYIQNNLFIIEFLEQALKFNFTLMKCKLLRSLKHKPESQNFLDPGLARP